MQPHELSRHLEVLMDCRSNSPWNSVDAISHERRAPAHVGSVVPLDTTPPVAPVDLFEPEALARARVVVVENEFGSRSRVLGLGPLTVGVRNAEAGDSRMTRIDGMPIMNTWLKWADVRRQ